MLAAYRTTLNLFTGTIETHPKFITKRSVVGPNVTAMCIDNATGEFLQLSGRSGEPKNTTMTTGKLTSMETVKDGVAASMLWT